MGKMLTKIELTLEQTQQGVSDEVLILHIFYKMDVKTAFLNGELREEQSLRAWYDMLSKFLLSQEFSKGVINPTLFTRKEGKDIILVQIYLDDIILAFTHPALCDVFANIMSSKFKMSMMGKIDSVDTPMVGRTKLDEDLQGTLVDPTCYRVKRVFRYLKGTPNMGLWYSKDIGIALTTYVDANHVGCQVTRRSTSGSAQFLGDKLHSRSKHIDVIYHFISKKVENSMVELDFIRIEYQLAVIFTKALAKEIFKFLINWLGMKSMSQETLKSMAEENEK
ncbi:retrovirus-related pol polyprotein from transposon TNT 1-94 [Tanacetum coccineum]